MNISTAFKIPEPLYWWALGSFSHMSPPPPRFLSSNPPHQMAIIHPFFSSVSSGALLAANALPPEARGPVFRCMVWAAINADDADAAKRWVKKSGDIMSGSKIWRLQNWMILWLWYWMVYIIYIYTVYIYYMGLIVSLKNFDGFRWEWIDLPCSRWPQRIAEFRMLLASLFMTFCLHMTLHRWLKWLLTISSRCLQLHDHPGRERQDTGEQRKQEKTTKGPTNHDTSW